MKDIIVFFGLSFLCIVVWALIAHLDTYFGLRKKMQPEHLEGFNFPKYTASEIKRYFTGKGLF